MSDFKAAKKKSDRIIRDFMEAGISINKIGGDKTGAGPISDANIGGTITGAGPISDANIGGVKTAGVKAKAKKKLKEIAGAAATSPVGGATEGIPPDSGVK